MNLEDKAQNLVKEIKVLTEKEQKDGKLYIETNEKVDELWNIMKQLKDIKENKNIKEGDNLIDICIEQLNILKGGKCSKIEYGISGDEINIKCIIATEEGLK